MLVVTSAGNQGNRSWGYITAPADGDSVLAVGGLYANGDYWPVSSPGPTADGRIKPNVAGQAVEMALANTSNGVSQGNGTSFASPLIAGLAAGIWQAYPDLGNMDLFSLLERSGNNAGAPNNQVGYGLPSFVRARALMNLTSTNTAQELLSQISLRPNPTENGLVHLDFPQVLQGEACKVSVIDVSGKVVYQTEVTVQGQTSNLQLPDHLSNASYFVRVEPEGKQKASQLLKLILQK